MVNGRYKLKFRDTKISEFRSSTPRMHMLHMIVIELTIRSIMQCSYW